MVMMAMEEGNNNEATVMTRRCRNETTQNETMWG
jgi:hypothetical protein